MIKGVGLYINDTFLGELSNVIASGNEGGGILAVNSAVVIANSFLIANRYAGIWLRQSYARIVDTWVLDTLATELDGKYGDGIKSELSTVLIHSAGGVFPARVEGSARAGVSVFGRHSSGLAVTLENVALECNSIPLNGETVPANFFGPGVPFVHSPYLFDDAGGNVCSCGAVIDACGAESSTLEPPAPLPAP